MLKKAVFWSSVSWGILLTSAVMANERTEGINSCLKMALLSPNGFLKGAAEQEAGFREAILQENTEAWTKLKSIIENKDWEEIEYASIQLAGEAVDPVKEFASAAQKTGPFDGKTDSYSALKLECLVDPVKDLLTRHFNALIEGKPIDGFTWDTKHVAELDALSPEVMNGHMRTSVFAVALEQIAYAAGSVSTRPGCFSCFGPQSQETTPYQSLYDYKLSPQVYRTPMNPDHVHFLKGTLYDGSVTCGYPTVQSYGVYAWGGLRGNPLYTEWNKPLGQQDCCSFIQERVTQFTGEAPPTEYSTIDLRIAYLKLIGRSDDDRDVINYLCRHFEVVPIVTKKGETDLSQVAPGDLLVCRWGKDVTPDSGVGTLGGHVSIVIGFWGNQNPIVLEYNRNRDTGMDGFGCSVKSVATNVQNYFVLRLKS